MTGQAVYVSANLPPERYISEVSGALKAAGLEDWARGLPPLTRNAFMQQCTRLIDYRHRAERFGPELAAGLALPVVLS